MAMKRKAGSIPACRERAPWLKAPLAAGGTENHLGAAG